MYNVSAAYMTQLKKQEQMIRITGTIAGIPFTDDDIMAGTLQITNQCSEVNETKIGSVYIGELCMTLSADITFRDWSNLQIIINEDLWIEDLEQWESVPLGVYYIDQADDTEDGTSIVAYDILGRLNKTCDVDVTTGQPYDLLLMACNKCNITLGMTRGEVEALVNGTEAFVLYAENDIETWQDYVFWLAQTCCCIATASRIGTLVLRAYSQNVVDSLDDDARFTGSIFSKFITRYSGLSVVNIATQQTEYIGNDPDIYLTYNLGSNPFLQYGSSEGKERIRRNILNGLGQIEYMPFETKVNCGALYDLGDVIRCTDGIASGALSCVMYFNYAFDEYSLAGYGSNPALASAKGKTDKNLVGLANNIKNNDIKFYIYENAKAVVIGDGESREIIDIRFTSSSAMYVIFQAEILLEAETTVTGIIYDDAVARVSYILNGSEIQYFHPTETYVDGRHILHLANVFYIETDAVNRLIVNVEMDGGAVTIPEQNIRAAIYGQGLVGSDEWDGYLDFAENVSLIEFTSLSIGSIGGNLIGSVLDDPIWNRFSEHVEIIKLSSMQLMPVTEFITANITEQSYINEDNMPDIYDDTSVEVSDGSIKVIDGASVPQVLIKQMVDVDELIEIVGVDVTGTNITLQFSNDGNVWKSYVNDNWISSVTEMTVNQATSLTNEDWLKLIDNGLLWVKVSLNVANSVLNELSIEYVKGV